MICLRTFAGFLIVVLAFGSKCVFAHAQEGSLHKIEILRLDSRFDKLVPLDVKIDKIAGGHKWVEGPVWNRKDGFLLFSDIPNNSIYRWQESRGESLFLKPSGYTGKVPFVGAEPGSNGLAYDPAGNLVLADHGDRRIARLENNRRKTTLVDRYEGKRINSPNDVVFAHPFQRETIRKKLSRYGHARQLLRSLRKSID
jgi:gluconolactonase